MNIHESIDHTIIKSSNWTIPIWDVKNGTEMSEPTISWKNSTMIPIKNNIPKSKYKNFIP